LHYLIKHQDKKILNLTKLYFGVIKWFDNINGL